MKIAIYIGYRDTCHSVILIASKRATRPSDLVCMDHNPVSIHQRIPKLSLSHVATANYFKISWALHAWHWRVVQCMLISSPPDNTHVMKCTHALFRLLDNGEYGHTRNVRCTSAADKWGTADASMLEACSMCSTACASGVSSSDLRVGRRRIREGTDIGKSSWNPQSLLHPVLYLNAGESLPLRCLGEELMGIAFTEGT